MKITKTTGQTCVGDVRLTPLDVGFDLRAMSMLCEVPEDAVSAGFERDGETYLVEGTREEIVGQLIDAGYKISEN